MTEQQQPNFSAGPNYVAPPMALDNFPGVPVQPAPYVDPHDLPPTDGSAYVTPAAPPKWTCETPPSTFLLSLNGFDEIAITKHFGARITELQDEPITGGRALVFIHKRRTGSPDAAAFEACMGLTMQQVMDYFHPEPPKADASAEGNAPSA